MAVTPASTITEALVDDEIELQVCDPEAFRGSPTDSGEFRYSDPLRKWIVTLHAQDNLSRDWYDDSTTKLTREERFFAFQEYDHLSAHRQYEKHFNEVYGGWTPEQFAAQDAEVAAEYAIHKLLPPGEKRYQDGPSHGSPEAHAAFAEEYVQHAKKILDQWMTPEIPDDQFSLHDLEHAAREERSAAHSEANFGTHYSRYLPGHEVLAARFRARHHAIHVIREVSDRVWDSDKSIGILCCWLRELEAWAAGDVSERVPVPLPDVLYAETTGEINFPSPVPHDDRNPLESESPKKPAPPIAPPGFCTEFVNYANATARREQPILALLASIALVATLAGRKYRDSYDTRMNLYVVGLAKTGAGKDHARKLTKKLLAACERAGVLVESFASAPAVVKAVSDRGGECLALIDELGKYLAVSTGKSAEGFQSQILTVWMKLFTSSDSVYVGESYVAADRKEIILDQPILCINGTTTPTTFFAALASKNISDGFMNRLLAIAVEDDLPDNVQPKLQPLPPSLVEMCRFWSSLKAGEGDLAHLHPELIVVGETPDVSARFEHFSKDCDRIARTDRTQHTRDIYVRQFEMARKLALIFAVSEAFAPDAETGLRPDPHITLGACEWAIGFATYFAEYVEKAVGENVSDNSYQSNAKRVLRVITESRQNYLDHSILARKLDHCIPSRDLAAILVSLQETGQILVRETSTGGRKKRSYVAN